MTVVVSSTVTGPQAEVYCTSTSKYHAADKHDTPSSYFKLTLGQSALL